MAEGMIDFAQSYFSFVIAQRALPPPSPSHLRPLLLDYGGQAGRGEDILIDTCTIGLCSL